MKSRAIAQDTLTSSHGIPLSTSQERLWVLDQLHSRSAVQNVACGLRLAERLDRSRLEADLNEVLQQHEILRAEFHLQDGVPVEFVRRTVQFSVDARDLRNIPSNERLQGLSRLAQEAAEIPFDLGQAPLLRSTLFQLEDQEHVLLIVAHRIVCDEPSIGNLLSEVQSRYLRGGSGRSQNAPVLQYRDVVDNNAASDEDVVYWKQRLDAAPQTIELPADRQRPAIQSFRGARQKLCISERLWGRLQALGQSHGSDLFTTLLTAFAVLLSRYSRQDDFVIGTRVSGRTQPEFANVIGPLENMLALRIDASGDPSFLTFLMRVREVTEGAFSHQDFPFETLVKRLRLERDMSRHPVFQVMFTMQNSGADASDADALNLFEVESRTELVDLSVEVTAKASHLEANFSYSSGLFDAATIGRMMEHFSILLEAAVADGDVSISRMPLLSAAERSQLLVEWNETAIEYPAVECVHQLVEAQVERTPNAVAVTFNDQSLTYDDLNRKANRLAHYLREIGVKPNARVAICVERGLEMMVAVLGILKAGGGYVPLDPAYPIERLKYMLQDSGATALLTQGPLKALFSGCDAGMPVVDVGDANPVWSDQPETNPDGAKIGLTSAHLAYVIYTSGSTGAPKGVMVEHQNVTRLFTATDGWFHFSAHDVWTLFHSYAFDFSVWEIWGALFYGGRLVVVPQNTARSPEDFYELICREKVTILNQTPSAFRQLITAQGKSEQSHQLRHVIFGGEALEVATLKPWYDQNSNANTQLINMYGITETTVHVTYRPLEPGDTERRGASPIGSRIPDLRIYILDSHRQPVPIGVVGELHVAGAGVARGYLNRPELTAERFLPDPFANKAGERMYKAGDLGRWLGDGTIEFLGRNDFQVKIRGFRIELGEIEARLAEYAGIREAVVIAREDTPGERRLVAYYTCQEESGQGLGAESLRAHVAAKLPDYMVPAAYVQLEIMPLTQNGKLNLKALPLPGGDAYAAHEYEAPQGETEATLTRIWAEVLNLERVGRHDNFFDLGGHSLTATRVLSQVKETTGRQIPLSALFRGATVESLARLIDEHVDAREPVVMEIQHGDTSRLPFFAIVPPGEESLGYAMLARHMGPKQTVYKIQGHAPVLDDSRPHTKEELQQITVEYVTAIRSVQPHGPYCMGGLCDGTHIAEQIVLNLEAQGEEVGLFAIFDTWVMQHSQIRWLWKVDYYRQRLLQMKKMSFREQITSYKRVAENKVLIAAGKKAPRTDWQERYWPENFTPQRFRAPVILFKRPKQQFYYINDPQLGWGQRSEGGVEVHEIEFHHEEILREPHVAQFGELLAESIRRVSGGRVPQGTEPNRHHQNPPGDPAQHVRQGV